jgi:hypothetical protein
MRNASLFSLSSKRARFHADSADSFVDGVTLYHLTRWWGICHYLVDFMRLEPSREEKYDFLVEGGERRKERGEKRWEKLSGERLLLSSEHLLLRGGTRVRASFEVVRASFPTCVARIIDDAVLTGHNEVAEEALRSLETVET